MGRHKVLKRPYEHAGAGAGVAENLRRQVAVVDERHRAAQELDQCELAMSMIVMAHSAQPIELMRSRPARSNWISLRLSLGRTFSRSLATPAMMSPVHVTMHARSVTVSW